MAHENVAALLFSDVYKIEQTFEPAGRYFREIVDKGSGRRQSGGEESATQALQPPLLCCSSRTAGGPYSHECGLFFAPIHRFELGTLGALKVLTVNMNPPR